MGFKQYLSHQPVNADYDNYTENIDLKLLENPSPSSWPYICVAVRPEIYPYGIVECIKIQYNINLSPKLGTFSLGACLKFTSQIKCDFISSPQPFKPYKTENMYSNVYFPMLGLDFVVFQRNRHETN